jgi:hypothetical protein
MNKIHKIIAGLLASLLIFGMLAGGLTHKSPSHHAKADTLSERQALQLQKDEENSEMPFTGTRGGIVYIAGIVLVASGSLAYLSARRKEVSAEIDHTEY